MEIANREEFRRWLTAHHDDEQECYLCVKRGRPRDDGAFYYLDAVEEALCFGWIDSTTRSVDGKRMQRFSPRKAGSNWTELNKERVRRLERLGLMTEAGRKVLPDMEADCRVLYAPEVEALKEAGAWEAFTALPLLYQNVRLYNLDFYRKRLPQDYPRMLQHTVETAKQGQTFGDWNDYGRLS